MKILILGAGQVGATLAEHLLAPKSTHDVVVVDMNRDRLEVLSEQLDVRTVEGNAAHPDVLEKAEAADADLLIAVTGDDEVNIVASLVCRCLYNTRPNVVRLRSTAYRSEAAKGLFEGSEQIPIDERINPEQVVVNQFDELLQHPGSLQVLSFAEGLVKLAALRLSPSSPMVGKRLSELHRDLRKIRFKVVAIYRGEGKVALKDSTMLEHNDEVFFLCFPDDIDKLIRELNGNFRPVRRVAVAGCGNIGTALAKRIERRYDVKVLEPDEQQAARAAETLRRATVIRADATQREMLEKEHLQEFDVFCAVTNDDEVNFMASVLAKQLGIPHAIALISNSAYADLVELRNLLDVAISPKQAAAGEILSVIRTGAVEHAYSVRKGVAEAMMVRIQDGASIKPVGKTVQELPLRPGVSVGALVRNGRAIIEPEGEVLQANDSIILFVPDKQAAGKIARQFSLSPFHL